SRSRKTPHTTDYLTSLLAVAIVIEHLGHQSFSTFDNLADKTNRSLQTLEPMCLEIGKALFKNETFYFLGAGPSFGTAQYAAAKFWEAGGLKAFAFELEEFAHGPHLLVDEGDPVFVIAPSGSCLDRARVIVEGLTEIGLTIYAITDDKTAFPDIHTLSIPPLSEAWSPFLTSLPAQWLCWAISSTKGYDVVTKDGRHPNPGVYESAHRAWVRD
ncbi:MAG: SIS domain-containing protein, partial [Anaerolineae bacterium]|nr:SIS domain-containing protein [Anaerolineae bacterium]